MKSLSFTPRAIAWVAALCWMITPLRAAEKAAAEAKPREVLTAAVDHADALYRRGETVTFTVKLEVDGKPAESGEVEWTLTQDGVDPKRTGKAKLEGGKAVVTGTLDAAGFLQCKATWQQGEAKLTALAGAGFDPLQIKPSRPVPDDFVAFWAAKKKELAAIPVNARLTPAKAPEGIEAFDVQADSVGAGVSAYFARPVGAKPKSLPIILTVHGAGVVSSQLSSATGWAKSGALAMDMNAHGLPNGKPKEFYDALAAGELKDYRVRGNGSRDTIYFLGMFLRLVRAIDFLTAQPEWDGRTVVVSGSSQGGAQAIAAAGLDARVTFFAAGVPAMCDHTGSLAERIAGWPKFIKTGSVAAPEVVAAVRYFDSVNFAALAKAPGFFTVGFIDTTCPPTTVYAAYNALKAEKGIFNDIPSGHTNSPAASKAMRDATLKHFAAMREASAAR